MHPQSTEQQAGTVRVAFDVMAGIEPLTFPGDATTAQVARQVQRAFLAADDMHPDNAQVAIDMEAGTVIVSVDGDVIEHGSITRINEQPATPQQDNTASYVPGSAHELIGFLATIVENARVDHPDDETFARGVAAYEAFKAANVDEPAEEPTNPDRRCHRCGATAGLRLLPGNPLTLADREWQCTDQCAGGAR